LQRVLLSKNAELTKATQLKCLWRIMQEGLDEKRNNTSYFLQGVASIYENLTWDNTKSYQQRIVQENLKREKTNKSQAINTSDTGDLFYRGSVHQEPNPH
jgi:predicted transcriptional regulator